MPLNPQQGRTRAARASEHRVSPHEQKQPVSAAWITRTPVPSLAWCAAWIGTLVRSLQSKGHDHDHERARPHCRVEYQTCHGRWVDRSSSSFPLSLWCALAACHHHRLVVPSHSWRVRLHRKGEARLTVVHISASAAVADWGSLADTVT